MSRANHLTRDFLLLSKVLNPELVKGPWTDEEDAKVINCYSE